MTMNSIPHELVRVFIAMCDEASTPLSMMLKKAAIDGDVHTLVTTRVDPRSYDNAHAFRADNDCSSFFRKFPGFDLGKDLEAESELSFFASERHNARTNQRLKKLRLNYDLTIDEARIMDFLDDVRRKVSNFLGPIPDGQLLLASGRHGRGATFSDIGVKTTILHKMSTQPTINPEATLLTRFVEDTAWFRGLNKDHQNQYTPRVVRGNRFTSVSKDALKRRGICIEPSVTMFMQLAVGSHIKRRLLSNFGYNLFDAQTRHRELARKASIDGSRATIDLSDASDLQSIELVRAVCPPVWFDLLDSLRCHMTKVGDKFVKVEKFSSMGNGFTFELMTVILTAIACTLADKIGVKYMLGEDISVFGDDIIAPTDVANELVKCLPYLGYKVNTAKSFIDGPFRESCGGDFFRGIDVRPYFQKEIVNEPQHYIALANGIYRLGSRDSRSPYVPRPYFRSWLRVLDALPGDIRRLRGPQSLGDLVIHDEPEKWLPNSTQCDDRGVNTGIRRVRAYLPVSRKMRLDRFSPFVILAAALYGVPSDGVTPRGFVSGYRVRLVNVGW